MNEVASKPRVYGLLAEFSTAESIVEAARQTRMAGYRCIDALTPFPVHGIDEALALPPNRVPLIFFIGGIVGALTGFLMQVFAAVFNYPINVGGRPLYSWPAFIPITFELTILFAGLSGAFGMLALNGFPKPYHPLFNAPNFDLATQNRFFLLIQADDPQFDHAKTRAFLESLKPADVNEVPV